MNTAAATKPESVTQTELDPFVEGMKAAEKERIWGRDIEVLEHERVGLDRLIATLENLGTDLKASVGQLNATMSEMRDCIEGWQMAPERPGAYGTLKEEQIRLVQDMCETDRQDGGEASTPRPAA